MQAHKQRCGSSSSPDMAQKISKPTKLLEKKPSLKAPMEKRAVIKPAELQAQLSKLQDELKKAKEELAGAKQDSDRAEFELGKARESETKMLESLVEQTKQLEQTMISLEEAKLELREFGPDKDVKILNNELKLAVEAEDKSKKAMDDLAVALHEVTVEANREKSEAENLRVRLKVSEEKLQAAEEESSKLKAKLTESTAAWVAKENGFIDCMKVSEEEISNARRENDRLVASQRMSREDNSRLRDILKQAVNEATVVKEALEITRKENSQLKDVLAEKDDAFRRLKQEYDCLKLSEAAAVGSVKELKGLIATTSTSKNNKNVKDNEVKGSNHVATLPPKNEKNSEVKGSNHVATLPSEQWKSENPQVQLKRRHSVGGNVKSKGSIFDIEGTLERRNQILLSTNNTTDLLVPSLYSVGNGSMSFDDFGHVERNHVAGIEQDSVKQKKKKPMFQRFGDMIRRRSFHK